MYRTDGPEWLRPIGESEFLNGQAAMAASCVHGPCRVAAGIVSYADLRRGEAVHEVLQAHIAAAPGRFRGIRQEAMWDADETILGGLFDTGEGLYGRDEFRRGFACPTPLGLSFDAFVLEPQLADVADLARAFPDTSIILDHIGNPVGIGRHAGTLEASYDRWLAAVAEIAACPNVNVKLGGLGSFFSGFGSFLARTAYCSERLADEWRPYVVAALDLFGADRAMFESNIAARRRGQLRHRLQRVQADDRGSHLRRERGDLRRHRGAGVPIGYLILPSRETKAIA